jgi:hypothetical protein
MSAPPLPLRAGRRQPVSVLFALAGDGLERESGRRQQQGEHAQAD